MLRFGSRRAFSSLIRITRIRCHALVQNYSTKEFTIRKPAIMTIQDKDAFIQQKLVDAPLVCERNFSEQFLEALWTNSTQNPSRLAFINAHDASDKVTYAQLYNSALSVGAFLEERGLRKGEVYSVVLPSSWEYMAAFAGGTLIGAVASGCSMAFTSFELARQFNDSGSKVVFCSAKKLPEVIEAIQQCPRVQMVIVAGQEKSKQLPLGYFDFHSLLKISPCLKSGPAKIVAKEDLSYKTIIWAPPQIG